MSVYNKSFYAETWVSQKFEPNQNHPEGDISKLTLVHFLRGVESSHSLGKNSKSSYVHQKSATSQ